MLGRGGVGAVYEAEDPELGRKVAIKVLREDREGDTEGLRREAQALARLVHPNVLTVHDVGVANGEVYVVMQLVSGQTIDGYIAARRASRDKIVELYRKAGEGLAAAHAAGVVHCDFKPGNILVDDHGHVRVSDFGLAKVTRAEPGADASLPQIAGTPAYMAPEQFSGVATPASDQFAFCVALWEALAGQRPFADTGLDYVERKPPPRHAKVPARFARVLERGMATDPADRYPSMLDLLAELRPRHVGRRVVIGLVAVATIAIVAYVALRGAPVAHVRDESHLAKPVALTSFGATACAYAPAIEPGGKHVVFDRTQGETVDLYAVPLAGGAPRQLTSGPHWEWRAQPGRRAGEVVHLIHHPKQTGNDPKVAYLDIATGAETIVLQRLAWDAVVVGDSLYYAPDVPHGIRRFSTKGDTELVKPPEGFRFILLAGARRGGRVAAIGSNSDDAPVKPCVVDLETRAITCSNTEATPARPAFGADGRTLYFAVDDEIRAWDLESRNESLVFKGDYPEGGLAISPDGSALVYSTCFAHSVVVDAATERAIVDDQNATQPTFAATGATAWVSVSFRSRVLVAATPDGRRLQLTNIQRESVYQPSFKRDGTAIVYTASVPNPGVYIVRLAQPGAAYQLTNNASDQTPLFTADGRVVFTRNDDSGNAQPHIIPADGGQPQRLGTGSSRTVWGTRGTDVLVFAAVSNRLYWMDIATGAERPGPPQPDGELQFVALSPSGTWIVYQLGANGQALYRARLEPPGPIELVREYAAGQTVGFPAIDDTGRVAATPGTWAGDLFVLRPRDGYRF